MIREDNNGFINFPPPGKMINRVEGGKTLIYLVAFDVEDTSNKPYILSNLRLLMPGDFISDDINLRQKMKNVKVSLDELVQNGQKENDYDRMYFPNDSKDDKTSIPLTTAICIGWSDFLYEIKDNIGSWSATFKDLTHEGRKLYYSIKKLHNNKEVRILTFNIN